MMLEKETGQIASMSSWAEAAGVEKSELRQQLHYGWQCRDELLTSTRSLVLFIARNYRGLGVAFEDLIQVLFYGDIFIFFHSANVDFIRSLSL